MASTIGDATNISQSNIIPQTNANEQRAARTQSGKKTNREHSNIVRKLLFCLSLMCHVYAFSFRSNGFYNLIFIPSARIEKSSVCARRANQQTNAHVKYNKIIHTSTCNILWKSKPSQMAKRISKNKTVEKTSRTEQ